MIDILTIRSAYIEAAKRLLKRGAKVEIMNRFDETALDMAESSHSAGADDLAGIDNLHRQYDALTQSARDYRTIIAAFEAQTNLTLATPRGMV